MYLTFSLMIEYFHLAKKATTKDTDMKNVLLSILAITLFTTTEAFAQLTVWPGDVNNNGQVTNADLLYFSLGYNTIGPPRDTLDQGTVWAATPANSWQTFLSPDTTLNAAYADCNGDGFIDTSDIAAIEQNYLLTTGSGNVRPDVFSNSATNTSPFFFEFPNNTIDTLFENMAVTLNLRLGSQQFPVDSLQGISFSIEFDTSVVAPGSWAAQTIGALSPTISTPFTFMREVYDSSRVDFAFCVSNNPVRSDSAILALSFIIEDNLIGIAQNDSLFELKLRNITLMNGRGEIMDINAADFSTPLRVEDTINSIHELDAQLQVFPNPANHVLQISGIDQVEQIVITDLTGATVKALNTDVGQNRQLIETESLPNGMYIIQVHTTEGMLRRKILIAR